MGPYNANGAMLRWSDQLLLTAENHHFEVSMHLKVNEQMRDWMRDGGIGEVVHFFEHGGGGVLSFIHLQVHDTFKLMPLRRQEELVGPPQHATIRVLSSHDSSGISRAFEQLQ